MGINIDPIKFSLELYGNRYDYNIKLDKRIINLPANFNYIQTSLKKLKEKPKIIKIDKQFLYI